MIYFVVAQQEVDGVWKLFGPWENIEKADSKIVELDDDDSTYSQVELARVLTDEDRPDREEWLDADKHDFCDRMSDDEIRDKGMTQFLCKKCSLICDENWLSENDNLCVVCSYREGELRR